MRRRKSEPTIADPWSHGNDDPWQRRVVFCGPDTSAEDLGWDVPIYAYQYEELLEQARTALDRRKQAYPDMVTRRMITQDLATRDIRAWELIVAEWTWICTGKGALPPASTLPDRIAAVDLALQRIRQELDRGNRGHDLLRQSHLNQALHWHLHRLRHGEPTIHHLIDLTRRMRREIGGMEPQATLARSTQEGVAA